jgi:hypothetical protein
MWRLIACWARREGGLAEVIVESFQVGFFMTSDRLGLIQFGRTFGGGIIRRPTRARPQALDFIPEIAAAASVAIDDVFHRQP